MKIYLETKVEQDHAEVMAGFNEDLFKALAPPFPPSRLKQFDGSETGDIVRIEIWNLGWQEWIAEIIDHGASDDLHFFVDTGKKLPWPLKAWRHRHEVRKDGEGSVIVDDIEYSTGSTLLDKAIYPVLKSQFTYRQPIYRKRFAKK
jgi:ligand-binding SRPBCC domain-containing protein